MDSVYTNDIIAGLRQGDNEVLRHYSPYAACILPLVGVLEQRISVREVAEALPHYSFIFDMPALQSILTRLGYTSEKHRKAIETIEADQAPCLYVDQKQQVYVIYKRQGEKFIYFNASTGQTNIAALKGTGDLYFLTHCNSDTVGSRVKTSWFMNIFSRFNRLTKSLIIMSLVLNLTTLAVPLFIMVVYDFVIGKQNIAALPMLVIGIVIVLTADLGLRLVRSRLLAIPAGRLEYILATESLRQLLTLPAAMTERSSVAAQISKLRLYDSIRECFTGPTALLLLELPFIPLFVVVIAILGGSIVWVPVLAIVLLIALAVLTLPRLKKRMAYMAEARTERERHWLETLNGAMEIKSMAEVDHWIRRMREGSDKTRHAGLSASQLQAMASALTQGIATLAAVGVLALGGQKAIAGELSVGELIAIMALLWRVIAPLQNLFMAFAQLDQVRQGLRGLEELMLLKPERKASASSLLREEFDGDIKFERVSFRYASHLDPVLMGVSIHIPAKQFVVVVGENGSGKSTLLKLLCGLYHAQIGNVLVDDSDIRQLNANELRHIMGYVPQHPRLFHGDITHNLRFGNLLATEDELYEAARIAGVLSDIEKLPKGFSTRIGDQASDDLPSGLKRGLCMARALVRNSSILMFDEPGAGQDKRGLQHLAHQLEQLKGSKTIIAVSHEPQLIRLADQVIEMHRGSIKNISAPEDYLKSIYGETA